MSRTTAANSANSFLQRSRLLGAVLTLLYAAVAVMLFVATHLPLEFRFFLICLLCREWQQRFSILTQFCGEFFIHINGECRIDGVPYKVSRVLFFSRYLIILELKAPSGVRRLPLVCDAVPDRAFRHFSRVCLAIER
ncbi:protein YgfX [Enterovibrio paralichthyis]|uniref:protein YgfX n=1 Tax=Enterovibrio paralichthyis TaxID=2853805 RepID=UPI001C475841|nr:hypothetical protein [Enterovibrio paralichthyis]